MIITYTVKKNKVPKNYTGSGVIQVTFTHYEAGLSLHLPLWTCRPVPPGVMYVLELEHVPPGFTSTVLFEPQP